MHPSTSIRIRLVGPIIQEFRRQKQDAFRNVALMVAITMIGLFGAVVAALSTFEIKIEYHYRQDATPEKFFQTASQVLSTGGCITCILLGARVAYLFCGPESY